jgi:hypothetical protein
MRHAALSRRLRHPVHAAAADRRFCRDIPYSCGPP